MGQEPRFAMPEGLNEFRALLEAEWPARRAALHASGVPLCEEPDPADPAEPDADPADPKDPDPAAADKTYDAAYVKKLRDENAKRRSSERDLTTRLKEIEDRDKTEAQKLADRVAEAEKKAADAALELSRTRVALRKGLTETQAKRLIGETEEDLEKDADELLASFKSESNGAQDASRRPRERLRPGAVPSAEEEETDPVKLAATVPRMY